MGGDRHCECKASSPRTVKNVLTLARPRNRISALYSRSRLDLQYSALIIRPRKCLRQENGGRWFNCEREGAYTVGLLYAGY